MIPKLPLVSQFIPRGVTETNGSDQYGAFHVAAKYSGFELPRLYFPRAVWHHGVIGPWEQFSKENLVFIPEFIPSLDVFVSRQEQVDYLIENGYKNTRAIGVPFIYVQAQGLKRISGSLLVMPGHSLEGMSVVDQSLFREYANQIKEAANFFSEVTVCLHPACLKNGFWFNEFEALGFDVIEGASSNDANALVRMKALFEQFDFMTTNAWGSHVAYALAEGCKVSIYGKLPQFDAKSLMLQLGTNGNFEDCRIEAVSVYSSDEFEREQAAFLGRLHVHPTRAVSNIEMGAWLLGTKYKISPSEMVEVLGKMLRTYEKQELIKNGFGVVLCFIWKLLKFLWRFASIQGRIEFNQNYGRLTAKKGFQLICNKISTLYYQ